MKIFVTKMSVFSHIWLAILNPSQLLPLRIFIFHFLSFLIITVRVNPYPYVHKAIFFLRRKSLHYKLCLFTGIYNLPHDHVCEHVAFRNHKFSKNSFSVWNSIIFCTFFIIMVMLIYFHEIVSKWYAFVHVLELLGNKSMLKHLK